MATDRTMYLHHITHKYNHYPIVASGLQPYMRRGKREAVWLVTASKVPWAINHVMKRHGYARAEILIVKVRIRRSALVKTGQRGCWSTPHQIMPNRIQAICPCEEIAQGQT